MVLNIEGDAVARGSLTENTSKTGSGRLDIVRVDEVVEAAEVMGVPARIRGLNGSVVARTVCL
jgi:LmbE family N-acetylglucosaminyl deacetylase